MLYFQSRISVLRLQSKNYFEAPVQSNFCLTIIAKCEILEVPEVLDISVVHSVLAIETENTDRK